MSTRLDTNPADTVRRLGPRHVSPRWALALGIALVLGGCTTIAPQIEQTPTAEASAEVAVKGALTEALGVSAAAISVAADEESIALGGFVANESQRDEALAIARRAAGSRRILDTLHIRN